MAPSTDTRKSTSAARSIISSRMSSKERWKCTSDIFFGDDVVLCLCFVFVSDADAGAQTVGVYMDSLKNREWDGNDIAALSLLETGGKCREGYKAVRK